MTNVSVLLVDNEPLRQAGFRAVLSVANNISVVGTCTDLSSARQMLPLSPADVILLASGKSLATALRSAQGIRQLSAGSKIVFIRNLAGRHEAEQLLASGASGCIGPDINEFALLGAVMIASAGGTVFCPALSGLSIAEEIENDLNNGLDPAGVGLTSRERQVLGLLSMGMPNKTIADRLFLSENTVKKHVSEALRKTRQSSRFNAGLYARRHGLVP